MQPQLSVCVFLYGRTLNVDMEWLYGASESSNMEVDIGYLPQVRANDNAQHVQRVLIYDYT